MIDGLVNAATRVGGGGGSLLDIYQVEHLGWGLQARGRFASAAALLTVPGYLVMPFVMRVFGADPRRPPNLIDPPGCCISCERWLSVLAPLKRTDAAFPC